MKSTQYGFLEILATYDTEDRLLSFGNRTYTYDANGARQTQTENGTETRYRYDNLGALKSVTKSGQTIDYITDATGRRVGRKVNGSVESYFTYQDSLRPIAQYNADGSIRWTIVYAERMNVPSLLISSNGTRYRVVSDHLGSVRLIINTLNGQIVQRMDYDVWGKVTDDSNPNFQPFGFAGGLYDSATELVRFGARDYDPYVGRWLSKDPIGFAGGDTNLYGYVIQDPVNWIDLNGRQRTPSKDMDKVGICAVCAALPPSLSDKLEYGGAIYQDEDGNFVATPPKKGKKDSSGFIMPPKDFDILAWYHTLGDDDPAYDNSAFSNEDKLISDMTEKSNYMVDPKGFIRRYDPDPNKEGNGKVTKLGRCE